MIVDKKYSLENKPAVIKNIVAGKIFIYPTDTIYGVGCNALDENAVAKIRELKQREVKPFSIIAPSMSWIMDNCQISNEAKISLDKLPGPYTLFLKLKKPGILPDSVNPQKDGTIGIRIPRHWFTEIISNAGIPFITTSVNVSGMAHMTSMSNLDETIKNNVDFIIYEGEINGQVSTKIDLTKIV